MTSLSINRHSSTRSGNTNACQGIGTTVTSSNTSSLHLRCRNTRHVTRTLEIMACLLLQNYFRQQNGTDFVLDVVADPVFLLLLLAFLALYF